MGKVRFSQVSVCSHFGGGYLPSSRQGGGGRYLPSSWWGVPTSSWQGRGVSTLWGGGVPTYTEYDQLQLIPVTLVTLKQIAVVFYTKCHKCHKVWATIKTIIITTTLCASTNHILDLTSFFNIMSVTIQLIYKYLENSAEKGSSNAFYGKYQVRQ